MEWYEWAIPLIHGVTILLVGEITFERDIRDYCRKKGLNVKEFKKLLKDIGWL